MTNTVNLQKMLQAEKPSVKKQVTKDSKNDSGDEFKNLVSKKAETAEQKEEPKLQEKKPEEDNSQKKEKKELKPGEVVPLADLLFSRPEILSDAEKAVVMTQFPVEHVEQGVSQLQDMEVQLTDQDNQVYQVAQDTIKEMAGVNAEIIGAAEVPVVQPAAVKIPETEIPMAKQPSSDIQIVQQTMAENPVEDLSFNSNKNQRQQQVIDNGQTKNLQHVDKQLNKENIVDRLAIMEEKPIETVKVMAEPQKEEIQEQEGDGNKELRQLTEEEKSDKDGKTEHVLDNDYIKPETVQKEVVKVKVAEPYDRLNTETVKDLADKLTERIANGKREFTIQLNPEMLGRIAVKISMADDGIKVTLSCEKQKTCQLLAEQASGINRIVEHNTGQPAVVEVKEGYWEQQKDAMDQNSKQNQNQEQREQDKASKAETDDFIQQLRLGFLDYRISV